MNRVTYLRKLAAANTAYTDAKGKAIRAIKQDRLPLALEYCKNLDALHKRIKEVEKLRPSDAWLKPSQAAEIQRRKAAIERATREIKRVNLKGVYGDG